MTTQDDLKAAALEYHRYPVPGKIEISATKPLATQRDLALAYTPGVANVLEAIDDQNRPYNLLSEGSPLVDLF